MSWQQSIKHLRRVQTQDTLEFWPFEPARARRKLENGVALAARHVARARRSSCAAAEHNVAATHVTDDHSIVRRLRASITRIHRRDQAPPQRQEGQVHAPETHGRCALQRLPAATISERERESKRLRPYEEPRCFLPLDHRVLTGRLSISISSIYIYTGTHTHAHSHTVSTPPRRGLGAQQSGASPTPRRSRSHGQIPAALRRFARAACLRGERGRARR